MLEGASRPNHFRGAATVVLKLLDIVQPSVAAFGQKDAQQALIIQRMVSDLMFDVEILVLPTVREEDGLAVSSRNRNVLEAVLVDVATGQAVAVPERRREAVGCQQREVIDVVSGRRRGAHEDLLAVGGRP